MRFSKPAWVTHQDQIDQKRVTLYSCHVHPDGSRLATGGLDAKIRIWSTLPILNVDADNAGVPKKLCTLSMHSGPVLCVRWSYSGRWLASGSDDAIVMIWDLDPNGGGKAWGDDEPNVEGWKALKRLPGHDSDVTDLAWSPKDRFLASVGLDSKVIIWCGHNLEPLRKLDMHQGFVKGVCWDPVGEFLATQSDDKSVKVWRTTDWELEATISKPFQDSPGSTFFRRLSWSPDGAHITASNAMNNNGYVFVAAVIARNEWTSDICLVGHENTVEVAAYNPHIFLRDPQGEVQSTNICSVVALGADDLSISIWQTKSPRPLIVARDAFESQIFDLSWSMNGLTLYACSADGSLGVFDFDSDELDGIVTLDEKELYLKRFGFQPPPDSLVAGATIHPMASTHMRSQYSSATNGLPNGVGPSPTAQAAAAAAMDPGPAFDKKGRRRIKPIFVSALGTSGSFSSSAAPAPYAPVQPALGGYVPPAVFAQPTPHYVNGALPASASSSQPQFMQADYDRHRQSISGYPTQLHSQSGNPGFVTAGFEDPDGDARMSVPIASFDDQSDQRYSGTKRKASEITDGWDDAGPSSAANGISRAGPVPKARTLGGDRPREPVGDVRELRSAVSGYGFGSGGGGSTKIRLDVPPLKTFLSAQSAERDGDVFEAQNFDDGKPSEVMFISGKQTQFLDYPSAPPLSVTATGFFCAAALEDGSVIVYSHTGRRLLPTLALDSPCTFLEGCKTHLMVITAIGKLHVWNIKTARSAFSPVSLDSLLSPNVTISSVSLRPNGVPLILLTTGTAYTYDADLACFTKISEARWSVGSDVWEGRQRATANKALANRGAVAALESALSELAMDVPPLVMGGERPQWWDAAYTLGHLETRQHAAKALESPAEYKAAVLLYAKRIAEEGFRAKAEELIRDLCGPLYWKPGKEESWCPTVLGMQKRDLLKDVLSTFAKSKTLAKLGQDWQETLKRAALE